MFNITYRKAIESDLPKIISFCDFWMKGIGKRQGVPGAGDDFFVRKQRHKDYLKYKTVYLALDDTDVIGWAVKGQNDCLIHLLVAGPYRNKRIGSALLKILDPSTIRSKSDQDAGNPLPFYLKHNYTLISADTGKHHNIDILKKL